jgi:hemolysin activation/secretion protein
MLRLPQPLVFLGVFMRPSYTALAVMAFVGASVHAQAPTYDPKQLPTYDAGALARQAEQLFKQSQMQHIQPQRASLPPEMVINDATVVSAQRFKFNGNQLLTDGQLQAVALPFANRPLNQHDLQQLTHAVTEAYRQTGWLVQAYIPRQTLTGVALSVQVMETIPPSKPAR